MRGNRAARTYQQSERVRVLEATVSRVAAAVAATPTADGFLALSADIITVSTALNQQCTDRQLTQVLDSSIPSKLIETAVSALQAFSQAPAVTSDAVVRMWWPLDMLGRAALHLTSAERAEGRTPRRTMPEGFMPAWSAAAAAVLGYLKQHSSQQQPTAKTTRVLWVTSALLRFWRISVLSIVTTSPTVQHPVVPTLAVAAELAAMLLTCPVSAAQLPPGMRLAGTNLKYLHNCAGTTLHAVAMLAALVAVDLMGPMSPVLPCYLVSDSFQRAMVLHMAAIAPHCLQFLAQQAGDASVSRGGRSGNRAGAGSASKHVNFAGAAAAAGEVTAHAVLQQLGVPVQQVDLQKYGTACCSESGFCDTSGNTPKQHLLTAYNGAHITLVLRRQALGNPAWRLLYEGHWAAPPAAAAAQAVDELVAPVLVLGLDALLLQQLCFEVTAAMGATLQLPECAHLACAVTCWRNSLQGATLRSADPAAVTKCLALVWQGLGRQVLTAAGVPQEELDTDADAVAARSHGLMVTYCGSAERVASVTDMVNEYCWVLIDMFGWHARFAPAATDIYKQQPQLACRVIEAAARACKWPPYYVSGLNAQLTVPNTGASAAGQHFRGLALAASACQTARAGLVADAYRHPSICTRACSLAASLLKQAQQLQSWSGWDVELVTFVLALANHAALLGGEVLSAATLADGPCRQDAALAQAFASGWSPGGVSTAWLALTGRGLAAVGSVLGCAEPWICMYMHAQDSDLRGAVLEGLSQHGAAVSWLSTELMRLQAAHQQLQDASGPATGAAAAVRLLYGALRVDSKALRQLQQQAAALAVRWQRLNDACRAASSSGTRDAQITALSAFAVACSQGTDGWLPQALQSLGDAVWAAFPQKYACNDPDCDNLEAHTEASCARKTCTGCKVARYCCKEHATRHWSQHKKACKCINQAGVQQAVG